MSAAKPIAGKRNLLLCLDAFGTLFTPSTPIQFTYAQAATRHGINVGSVKKPTKVDASFKSAFKKAAQENPNYGKATGMGAEKWWSNVVEDTFKPFLSEGQPFPTALTEELLRTYSSRLGYDVFRDVHPFFESLQVRLNNEKVSRIWPWDKTIVGIITNSDDRVPDILASMRLQVNPRRYGDGDQGGTERKFKSRPLDDIDFTVLSYDVGFEKPDRRIFAAAEEMLALTLESMGSSTDTPASSFEKLYVGDDLIKDVFGAEDAGWSSVLVQRGVTKGLKVSEEEFEREGESGGKRTVTTVGSLLDLCAWRPDQEPERPPVRYVSPRRYSPHPEDEVGNPLGP
ncbi:hypothetical protein ACET3X_000223 [Alternaria dauci]|uniref:Haloacid dehalogenase n=1 Tax=Alternaria dauci TaxID=48095 RepID=A0ABR3UWW3_9PLEO